MPNPDLALLYDDLPLWSAPFGLTLLDTIRMRTHINVLDIGSGSGFPMLELAGRMGRSCMVYGLDPSEDAISMITAKKIVKEIEFTKIVKGYAEEIPFPDEYFGLIVSNNGLNNVSDQSVSLAECYRVADVDCQMVLTMNLPHTMTEFYDVYEETLQGLGMHAEIEKMHAHIDEKRKPVDHLKALILDAGFNINTINVDGFRMKFSNGTSFLNHYFIRNAFLKPWQAILPDGAKDQVFKTIETRLNEISITKGELIMSVPFACFDCIKNSPVTP